MNKPINWNLEFMKLRVDPRLFDLEIKRQAELRAAKRLKRERELARLAGNVESVSVMLEYAYELLDERDAGTPVEIAFRRAIKALGKLNKALEAESDD